MNRTVEVIRVINKEQNKSNAVIEAVIRVISGGRVGFAYYTSLPLTFLSAQSVFQDQIW